MRPTLGAHLFWPNCRSSLRRICNVAPVAPSDLQSDGLEYKHLKAILSDCRSVYSVLQDCKSGRTERQQAHSQGFTMTKNTARFWSTDDQKRSPDLVN